MKLTPKQQLFCDEYLIDLNATQAAIRAGYSERSAKEIGATNLTKHNVKNYIEERLKAKEPSLIASQDELLAFITSAIRGEEYEMKDRLKAADMLSKIHGLYSETRNMNHSGNVGIQIIDNIPKSRGEPDGTGSA